MTNGSRAYKHQVFNDSGYVLLYPNVADETDLLQAYPPNPYAESATQLFPLGTKLVQGERVWRYTKNGTVALNIAAPTQSAAAVHAEQDDDIVTGAASAIGSYEVHLTSTGNLDTGALASADGLKDGYLIVNDEAGEGQLYKIKSSEAFVTTGDVKIMLYDPLTVALTTSSQVGVVQNPFANVIVTTAVVSGIFTGVPLLAITANYYFWSQTGGPAPMIPNAAIAKGSYVVVGTTAAKADPGAGYTTELIIGWAFTPAIADTESFICYLTTDQ